jgi:lipopolysaccharide transport system ATP-binding protein
MEPAIVADALSKRYSIGEDRARYETLRDSLARGAARLVGRGSARERANVWALRDVSFEIGHGEVVGIIGRNGAGKTTLLRLLSRITKPTSGSADVYGQLASLLEVGTGFHPELTGRENVFLNGAVLGMRRREITAKLDDIVEFAGVERFLDTPVKRYSTGMQVRLAFAVAAHLEPDILVVDEVLAVGDAEFQRRSLGRMQEIGRSGRTVLLVSHSMPTITRLCSRALLLEHGGLVADGEAQDVVSRYLTSEHGRTSDRRWDVEDAPGDDVARLLRARVVGPDGEPAPSVDVRQPVGIELEFELLRDDVAIVPWLALYTDLGAHVFSAFDTDPAWRAPRSRGRYRSRAWVPGNLLNEGTILVTPSLLTLAPQKAIRHAHVDEAVAFQVVDFGEGDTARGHHGGTWAGVVRPLLEWTTEHDG